MYCSRRALALVVLASARRLCRRKPEAVEYTLSGAYDYVEPSLRPLNIIVHTNQPEAEYEIQELATQPEAVYVFFNRSWPLLQCLDNPCKSR